MAVVPLNLTDKISHLFSKTDENVIISDYILGLLWYYNWRLNFDDLCYSDRELASWFLTEEACWLENILSLLALGESLTDIVLKVPAVKKYGSVFTPLKLTLFNRELTISNFYLEYVNLVLNYETGIASFVFYDFS